MFSKLIPTNNSFGLRPIFRFSSSSSKLFSRLRDLRPEALEKLQRARNAHGNKEVHPLTLNNVLRGLRDVRAIFYDSAYLDQKSGINMRGYNLQEIKDFVVKAQEDPDSEGSQPLPEGVLWLLLTGEMPTKENVKNLSDELKARAFIPDSIKNYILSLPKSMMPLTQFSTALLHLQSQSQFNKHIKDPIARYTLWEAVYEDALDIIAKSPIIAAYVYRHNFRKGELIAPDENLDWAGNFAHMLGFNSPEAMEMMRAYLTVFCDHDGGNVSTHTSHVVGSYFSDPYLAFTAGINGLAGPKHGLASIEVMEFLFEMGKELGPAPNDELVKSYVYNILGEGRMIPGYNHSVLRHTDPRFLHLLNFSSKHFKDDSNIYLVTKLYKHMPSILKSLKNMKNPWPNVDAISGSVLYHYGMTEMEFYIIVMLVSRSIGSCSNLILQRYLELAKEQPKSVSFEWIEKMYKNKHAASE